jgi:deoxyribonuclease V
MKIESSHNWNLSVPEAIELQKQLAGTVVAEDKLPASIKYVAGIDLGYVEATNTSRAVVVVLSFPDLELQETAEAILPIQFPYVPGLLSFRETPVAIVALEKLKLTPDLILCDGQGLAHPRKFGIACHIGVLTGIPTVGVAKSLLVGKYEEPGAERGSTSPLVYKNEQLGAVLRTRDNTRPLYVSIGHRISLPTAINYVLKCTPKIPFARNYALGRQISVVS